MALRTSGDFLTVREVAELLKVRRTTVWRWMAKGHVRASRLATGTIRLRETDERDIWAGYDPERTRRALKRGIGALDGVDRDELLKDIKSARAQDSLGRPA